MMRDRAGIDIRRSTRLRRLASAAGLTLAAVLAVGTGLPWFVAAAAEPAARTPDGFAALPACVDAGPRPAVDAPPSAPLPDDLSQWVVAALTCAFAAELPRFLPTAGYRGLPQKPPPMVAYPVGFPHGEDEYFEARAIVRIDGNVGTLDVDVEALRPRDPAVVTAEWAESCRTADNARVCAARPGPDGTVVLVDDGVYRNHRWHRAVVYRGSTRVTVLATASATFYEPAAAFDPAEPPVSLDSVTALAQSPKLFLFP